METTAEAPKVELYPVGARDPQEIESAFSAPAQRRVHGLTVFQDGMFLTQGPLIIALGARSRLPTMYGVTDLVRMGGLMGYGVHWPTMHRHGASYVDRILKGANPADLPVEQPTKFELVINLRTAKALGLTIPPAVLARADELIQ
jgi:putative ABC transport system substrate-binding protein